MGDYRILSVKRADQKDDEPVLLQITKQSSHDLDMLVIGTEGNAAFSTIVKHDELSTLKSKKFTGDEGQLLAALSFAFLGIAPDSTHRSFVASVELSAVVKGESEIRLSLQQNISGIIRPMAEITLKQDEETNIELFDWTAAAVKSAREAEVRVNTLDEQCSSKDATIQDLKNQLEEFVKSKQQHDNEMLERFRQLLNTKKLKIRDHQRLLSGVSVDQRAASEIQAQRENMQASGKSGSASKSTKRKPGYSASSAVSARNSHSTVKQESESDAEDAFENMETPDPSDTEESEESDVLDKRHSRDVAQGPSTAELSFNIKPSADPRLSAQGPTVGEDEDEETDDEL